MKKIYSFLIFALVMGTPHVAAQQLTLDAPVVFDGVTTFVRSAVQETKKIPALLADDSSQPTYSEWETCKGSWVYVSNYTKQNYPSTVRSRVKTSVINSETSNQIQLEITNTLFGTAILNCNHTTGRNSLTTPEGERVNLLGADGLPSKKYISSIWMPLNGAPANVMQYVASENIQIATTILEKNESTGEFDYDNSTEILYDYLYNTEAKPAKIDTEIPRLVKSQFSIEGKCGTGVTDLYFVQALSNRDEQKAKEHPELADYGMPVDYSTIPLMLSDYISTGKLNPAVKIEKVAVDEYGKFSVNVSDEWEGMRGLSFIALKDSEICDQTYADVEMRSSAGWKPYKNLDFTFTIPAALTEDNQDKDINKKAKMEINENAKLLRICQPYGNFASDYNYIYLDYSLGMDKCFVTNSYTPSTYTYTYYKPDMTESAPVTLPYHFESFVTANLRNGFSIDNILNISSALGWFFDLSSEIPLVTTIIQDENRSLFDGGIYVIANSWMAFAMSDVAGIWFDNNYFMNIPMGMDVAKVEFKFISSVNPSVFSQTYTIDAISDGEGSTYYFELIPELISGRIPKTADLVKFTFFNKSWDVIKSGELTIPFDMAADFAELSYENELSANTSGYRRCSYETSSSGNPLIKLYEFFDSYNYTGTYYGAENSLVIELAKESPLILDSYFGKLRFTGFGECDVYAVSKDNSLVDNIVKTTMSWYVYNDGNLIGYWEMSPLTITLPKHYFQSSTIEDIEIDTEASREIPVEYFNLQGQRITNPVNGNLYIERKAGKARKILY